MEVSQKESSSTDLDLPTPLLIYDGECRFCAGVVEFIFARELTEQISFMWLQDERTPELLNSYRIRPEIDSIILIEDSKAYTFSTAGLKLGKYLSWPWRWSGALLIVPRVFRDSVYRFIARHRKKIMGSTSCALPIGKENRFV